MSADRFERMLLISLGGHLVIGCLLFLQAVLVPDSPIEVRSAIRVDVVGLPAKMENPDPTLPPAETEPAPSAPKAPEKAKEKSEVPEMPDPKAKSKDLAKSQKKALEELKRQAALDRIKEQLANKGKSATPGSKIAGNKVAAGDSLTGLEQIEHDRYISELRNIMRANFAIPQWLAESGYKTQVRILVDERGYVIKKSILRSSGSEIFDAKAIEAIDSSSPLPAPPQRLRGHLATSGIILGFPE